MTEPNYEPNPPMHDSLSSDMLAGGDDDNLDDLE